MTVLNTIRRISAGLFMYIGVSGLLSARHIGHSDYLPLRPDMHWWLFGFVYCGIAAATWPRDK